MSGRATGSAAKSARGRGGSLLASIRRSGDDTFSARDREGEHRPAILGPAYLALLVLIVVAVTAAFLFHLHVRFEGVRLGYETSRARAVHTRLLLERRELRLELASLKSPERVEAEARERLDMQAPDHERIVPVEDDQRIVSASGGAI
ncbi:MAG: cell division protein FtsL [Polyangia bacterium]